jgi:hypothetical protein
VDLPWPTASRIYFFRESRANRGPGKLAKAQTAKELPLESLVITLQGQPALEVKWLSDVVFAAIAERVNWWIREADEIRRDSLQEAASVDGEAAHEYDLKLATCPLYTQTLEIALDHLRDTLPRAIHDLLHLLIEEAYTFTSTDLDHKCQVPDHRKMHSREDKFAIGRLHHIQRQHLERRLDIPLKSTAAAIKGD